MAHTQKIHVTDAKTVVAPSRDAMPRLRAALSLEFRKFLHRLLSQEAKGIEYRLAIIEGRMRISELGGMSCPIEIGAYGRDYAEHCRLCERLMETQDALADLGL